MNPPDTNIDSPTPDPDIWYDWLLHHRHGGNSEQQKVLEAGVRKYADRVLDGVNLVSGMTLADIGTGDGLIAFSAIDRVGPSLNVVMTDISRPLLSHAEALANRRGVRAQCSFVECSAELLEGIESTSVDAVTTRAVLAYVPDKAAAFREFHRVLKPGGRLSIAEPVNRDDAVEVSGLKHLIDGLGPDKEADFFRLMHRWKSAQYPDTSEKIKENPFTNYTERDLVRFALDARFSQIHMEFHVDIRPSLVVPWDVFIKTSPHPGAPTLAALFADMFTAEESEFLERVFRPQVERGLLLAAERVAYLTAVKPVP